MFMQLLIETNTYIYIYIYLCINVNLTFLLEGLSINFSNGPPIIMTNNSSNTLKLLNFEKLKIIGVTHLQKIIGTKNEFIYKFK